MKEHKTWLFFLTRRGWLYIQGDALLFGAASFLYLAFRFKSVSGFARRKSRKCSCSGGEYRWI